MFRSKRKAELSSLSDKVMKRVRVSKATKRAYRACAVRRGFALQCFLVYNIYGSVSMVNTLFWCRKFLKVLFKNVFNIEGTFVFRKYLSCLFIYLF